jgi:bifunctional ADP-heptose synthase (sugar kinase/adenylyltransferase)
MITALVEDFIEKAAGLRVAVVGETITDEFVFVSYEGPSMKSLCPALKLTGRKEAQQGGAAAIANHLRDFVKSVDVISNDAADIVKTRYVDVNDHKKHVEINKFDIKTEGRINVNTSDYDVVIVADFGHGFCNRLDITDGFHLMCQTNSNNFGFNRISKWKGSKKRTVCIDLREASLQMNKKVAFDDQVDIHDLYNYELNTDNLFITLGTKGSVYYNGSALTRHPSFKSDIVDTIGAGDTFFAFVSVASQVQDDDNLLVVPSLAASLSTTWLGNENSVTKETLRKYATQFI